jgi:hypothetical protein
MVARLALGKVRITSDLLSRLMIALASVGEQTVAIDLRSVHPPRAERLSFACRRSAGSVPGSLSRWRGWWTQLVGLRSWHHAKQAQ